MSLFSSTPKAPPPASLVSEAITMDMVHNLFPIRNYTQEKLLAFTSDLKSEIFAQKTILYKVGEKTDSAFYLLKGTISCSDQTGKNYEISSGTGTAKFPFSSGPIHTTTAIAKTDISVLRVAQNIMMQKVDSAGSLDSALVIPPELSKNRLMLGFFHHYNNEEMHIPSLPDMAVKLSRAMESDAGIADIVKIVQTDPVITAKLIGLANCPLYVSKMPVKSCFEAVNRIGLNATRNLSLALSLSQTFKKDASPLIKKYIDRIWQQSSYIASLCFILAAVTKQADPQEALLAGLICDIGAVPFLSFASNLPKEYCSETDIKLVLPHVKGPVGYRMLLDWGFAEEFLKVPLDSDKWYQTSGDKLTLTDIVVLSRLHSRIGQPDVPVITSVPAASKLKDFALSPELSLNILSMAKQQINETMRAFSG
jgi:HD-like signal output (HDOD) protein